MEVEGSIPPRAVAITAVTDSRKQAVAEFRAAHPGARVEAIDGEMVVGLCEACEEPIMEHDTDYTADEELIYLCGPCSRRARSG